MSETPYTFGSLHAKPSDRPAAVATRRSGGLLAGATGAILTWIERYRQRRFLHALSDHMLKDIGISRVDADRETGKQFWRG